MKAGTFVQNAGQFAGRFPGVKLLPVSIVVTISHL